jgi:hypothetical protein
MNNQIDDTIQYNRNEEPIVISKPTSDRLLQLERPADAMALYWFYYYTAKWQYSNTPHANNHYVTTGLKWTDDRLSRAKKDLINLGLIEQPPRQWNPKTKHIGYPQIKINFIWWDKKKMSSYSPVILPPTKSKGVGNEPIKGSTGTLNQESNNIVKKKKGIFSKADKESFDPEDLPTHLGKDPSVMKAWCRFVEHRKEKRQKITPIAFKMLVKKMVSHSSEEVVSALDRSVMNGWTGVFFDSDKVSAKDTPTRPGHPITCDPDSLRLYNWLIDALGRPSAVQVADVDRHVKDMHLFFENVPGNPRQEEGRRLEHATSGYSWNTFFTRYMEFIQSKQRPGYMLQHFGGLRIGGQRWNEFIQDCEYRSCFSWKTGGYIG